MPEPPTRRSGQDGRGRRRRSGRAGRRRRAQPLRALGHRLRARRGPRRPAAVRGPGRQAREVDHRPARGDPRAGGDRVRLRHRRRPRRDGRRAPGALRRAGDRDRLPGPARARGARAASWPASTRRWTTSTSATAGSPRRRAARSGRPSPGTEISARGQEGDRDRRRRHGHGLHLELPPRAGAERGRCSTSTPSCPPAAMTRAIRGRCRPSGPTRPTRSTRAASGAGGPR